MNLKNFGYEAIDYDIQNEFNETDIVIDLFKEIERAYNKEESIFDNITEKDMILAFFPCVRFEDQVQMHFRGTAFQQKKWTDEQKLEYDLKLHKELDLMYETITKLAIVCIRKNLKLIIENPYSEQHYLKRYWCIKPAIIDMNRRDNGDHFIKPTQYWFINCNPKNNFIFEPLLQVEYKIVDNQNTVGRSMIHPQYANRFIREFIIDEKIKESE